MSAPQGGLRSDERPNRWLTCVDPAFRFLPARARCGSRIVVPPTPPVRSRRGANVRCMAARVVEVGISDLDGPSGNTHKLGRMEDSDGFDGVSGGLWPVAVDSALEGVAGHLLFDDSGRGS